MCGVVGLISHKSVNQRLYDSLIVMQHRGQDAAGIMTSDGKKLYSRRKNGMVNDVFLQKHMQQLIGNTGIGHVRYPTAGSSSVSQAQPFYVNSPYGIALAHNGNLTNSETLKQELYQQDRRQINTSSDSEVLLNVFAQELYKTGAYKIDAEHVFSAVEGVHKRCVGAYAVVAMLTRDGLVGFRDPNGIRPLVLGKRETKEGIDYMLASESVALLTQGYTLIRDIEPGEAVYIDNEFNLHFKQCSDNAQYNSCIFEYIYFARPDSVIDNVFVHKARMRMGIYLAERIEKQWDDIDVVVPIPDTSRTSAMEIAHSMNKPYREGFIKNRYIGRTFIMPGQKLRKKSVRQKLNPIDLEFRDKNVLLVDDSIVRGTTSKEIVQMARDSGAKKVYFASASPEIRHPNIYGIDMPDANELIAYNRTVEEVCDAIGADGLIFQSLDDLKRSITAGNESLVNFDCSVFNGQYVTDVSDDYFTALEQKRADAKKNPKTSMPGIDLSNTA